ncbi:Hg(II)-responsive transcriptional regulator [Piscinibacter sakaiensis]|uniref:Hg(II)-responsive transcriptional regulator n=1 Tax=Piscinibacter sakaiensis TaxID=1547922 RepID=UPI003AACAE91
MQNNPGAMTIGALAAAADVGVETIRFYQRKGLLSEPARPAGGIRRYGDRDVARLRFVKAAQRLGFSLDEVAELLTLDDGRHCDEARALAEAKLADVNARLAGLRQIERALREMIGACESTRGKVCCPVIVALQSAH